MFLQPLLQCQSNKYYIFWACICSLRYTACNAHAPYCHLWPIQLYCIFPHYLVNSKIFKKKLLNIKCVFLVSLQLYLKHDLHAKYLFFVPYYNETLIFLTDSWKILKYHISWKSVQWELNCSMWVGRQMDGQTDMTKLTVAFHNYANVPKMNMYIPIYTNTDTHIPPLLRSPCP